MEDTGRRPSAIIAHYPLAVTRLQTIQIPQGAFLLSVHMGGGQLLLWALVSVTAPLVTRTIVIAGMGEEIAVDVADYIGAVHDDCVVWHVFEGRCDVS